MSRAPPQPQNLVLRVVRHPPSPSLPFLRWTFDASRAKEIPQQPPFDEDCIVIPDYAYCSTDGFSCVLSEFRAHIVGETARTTKLPKEDYVSAEEQVQIERALGQMNPLAAAVPPP